MGLCCHPLRAVTRCALTALAFSTDFEDLDDGKPLVFWDGCWINLWKHFLQLAVSGIFLMWTSLIIHVLVLYELFVFFKLNHPIEQFSFLTQE